ncbi:preprotein translocase subunit SecA, partial [Candidatus Pelagibacter bacterium]|nr:preprotein translocase subunit SecA [Candidatus Pelagibacter bacterium]
MNVFTRTFSKIFKSSNQVELDKTKNLILAINDREGSISSLSDGELREKTLNLKRSLKEGNSIDNIIPDSFALVREAAKRTLGERHYDVQLAGGIILHQGKIAEMKTGEGKTLVSTLPAYLNSLTGRGVHIVTVNDYLARRDSEWMGKVFNYLGVSTGCITNDLEDIKRKENYNKDITYATNNELGFDYLRDNMKYELSDMVQR